jgi:hypothetical protein
VFAVVITNVLFSSGISSIHNVLLFCFLQRSILEQQIKQKRQQAPHIRASDLQIIRSDGNKEPIHAYNGNLFINYSPGFGWFEGIKRCSIKSSHQKSENLGHCFVYDIEYIGIFSS